MYVIFPADEVVYLSYGRVIYVPPTNNKIEQVISSNNQNNNKDTSSSRQSISRTFAPSLPSTSTGSSRSTVRSSIGTFFHNGFTSDNNSDKSLKRNKSKSSKDSKDSEEKPPPKRPERRKKSKETVNVSEIKKNQYLRVPNNSVNNTKQQQQHQETTSTTRRLSYSDFLPHQRERLNASPKRGKVTKNEPKRNSSNVTFDELFNVQRSNSASNLPRLQATESFYSTTG